VRLATISPRGMMNRTALVASTPLVFCPPALGSSCHLPCFF
jgi:hypothetical protein